MWPGWWYATRGKTLCSDRAIRVIINARKVAELLRGNYLRAVYHAESSVLTLRELARTYLIITKDLTGLLIGWHWRAGGASGRFGVSTTGHLCQLCFSLVSVFSFVASPVASA